MEEGIDRKAMREYILGKFKAEGDYDFLKAGELEGMVDAMSAFDAEYMEKSGVNNGEVYDDDAAYELILAGMKKKYPDYEMYCMRLTEDYLDFSEEYLASIDAIDWE